MGYDKPLILYEDIGYVLMPLCYDLVCFVCTPPLDIHRCALDMYANPPRTFIIF
jgi:hypothetical protein